MLVGERRPQLFASKRAGAGARALHCCCRLVCAALQQTVCQKALPCGQTLCLLRLHHSMQYVMLSLSGSSSGQTRNPILLSLLQSYVNYNISRPATAFVRRITSSWSRTRNSFCYKKGLSPKRCFCGSRAEVHSSSANPGSEPLSYLLHQATSLQPRPYLRSRGQKTAPEPFPSASQWLAISLCTQRLCLHGPEVNQARCLLVFPSQHQTHPIFYSSLKASGNKTWKLSSSHPADLDLK